MHILQVFLLLFLQAHHFSCDLVSVYENGNKDGCTNYSDVASIRDLPAENLTIEFLSEEFHLDSVLTIADRLSVVVRGMPSRLTCSHTDTGIHMNNVTDLELNGITLVSCGNIFNDSSYQLHLDGRAKMIQFMSSIYIFDCTDINIKQTTVIRSIGSGLVMFDNDGTINIHDSTFSKNKNSPISSSSFLQGGSGLHIVLSYCGQRNASTENICTAALRREIKSSKYSIKGCIFNENRAGYADNHESPKLLAEGFSRGGGLSIIVDTNSSANSIQVMDCSFAGNTALWGGGLYLVLVGNAHNNTIHISNCTFSNNSCTGDHYGGGGAMVGYQEDQDTHPHDNTVNFSNCSFESNRAGFGGGFSFYSGNLTDLPNKMIFWQSRWTGNMANIGAGVNIAPKSLRLYVHDQKTKIVFNHCQFTKNRLISAQEKNKSYRRGAGIFFTVGYYIVLEYTASFHENEATAMYLTSTKVEFSSNVNVTFSENNGYQGGAICMLGFAALIVNDNVTVRFENNSAVIAGGAIYQDSLTKRDYFASQSCFVRYNGGIKNVSERNIEISFKGNAISSGRYIGQSIHVTTLLPCFKSCGIESLAIFCKCIGNFSFEDKKDVIQISTAGSEVTMNQTTIFAVPGKKIVLAFNTLDDLSQKIITVYHVKLITNCSNITLQSSYTSDKSVTFSGEPEDEADVVLESFYIVHKFHVKMLQCPPGFFLEEKKCVCPSVLPPSLRSCKNKKFEATFHNNYWIGYENNSNNLIYGLCPFTNCQKHNGSTRTLPQDASAIENETCGENYHGILCSQCREGYALQYNDYYYSCREIRGSCKRGWLLYIAMEVIPVTIFFAVVMVFNIQFTDGAINGVILFIQISDTMLIRANGIIWFQSTTYTGLEVYRSFSRMFNLNFFSVDQNEHFSFCLWERASTLDLLLFKYVTILYASTLVVVIIVVFKYCHSKTMNSILVRMKGGSAASTKSTIIHGMSGFLVICYSECARISFLLITPATLYSQKDNTFVKNVAYHNGELPFFSGTHLFYALPAILIILALGVLPPLILISYPLCYRVLAFLKIGETRFSKLLCTCIPLEKFKPFFDSFQSNFKDEYRFFSGLYFLYRFTTVATFAFSTTTHYYMIVQVQFAVIFALHAICQPYKKHWHNILDSLLFLNLSLVNIITYFSFQDTISGTFQHHIAVVSTIQVILLYLPLVYITIYIAVNIIRKAKVGSRASSLISRVKSKPRMEPNNYRQLESMLSLSIAEERKLD